MMRKGIFRWLLACAAAPLVLAGCSGGGGGGDDDGAASASILFLNGSLDSAALDFLVEGDVEANNLAYLGTSQGFRNVESGSADLVAREEGSTIAEDAIVGTFAPDGDYVALTVGRRNFGAENLKRLRVLLVGADRTVPNGNKARLIIVHGFLRGQDFDTPSIDFRSPGANPQFQENDIPYTASRTILVDAGTQTFVARRTGTEQIYAERTETLGAGKVYLALVTGAEGETGATAPQIHYVELPTEN